MPCPGSLLGGAELDTPFLSRLLRAGVREHLCKLVYADEWARSVEESHDDSEARRQALDTHWQEVRAE